MGEKKGFFKRLVEGLTKTRNNIVSGIDSIFSGFSHIDDDFYEEIEEILIMGDLGVHATEAIPDTMLSLVLVNPDTRRAKKPFFSFFSSSILSLLSLFISLIYLNLLQSDLHLPVWIHPSPAW